MSATLHYEKRTCGRCGGSPTAFRAFSHINAGRCFKCNGRGYALTANGARAAAAIRAFIVANFTVKGPDLAVGMRVEAPNGLKRTIVSIEPTEGGLTVTFNKPYENLHGIVSLNSTLVADGAGLVKPPGAADWDAVIGFARTLKLKGLSIADSPAAEAA